MSSADRNNSSPAPAYHHRPRPRVRLGGFSLQGKVILTLLALVSIAIAASCWLFATQSDAELTQVMDEQARLVAYTLSLASAPVLATGNKHELDRIGRDLLNTHNVLYVAFYDSQRRPLSLAHRYAGFDWRDVRLQNPTAARDLTAGTQIDALSDGSFGEHVDVCARVVSLDAKTRAASNSNANTVGYLVVGVSLDREEAQVRWVNYMVIGVGFAVMLLSLPAASLVVIGIFAPIRQLVAATQQIAAGDLDIRVATNRSDLIGELARSFQTMVGHVRLHREDLAATNAKLADANAQLAAANRDLEQKVQQRTAQLQAANVRLSGEIAEKEDFLRAVSHDLTAPLRNIAGMAQGLLTKHQGGLDPDAVHRLQRIQKNVAVETDLINELLELSRIKTRRQKMERVETEALVRDLGEMFEEDLCSRGIALVVQTPLTPLQAEKPRIRQVFQNLIDNAIKYMGPPPGDAAADGSATDPPATASPPADSQVAARKREIRIGCTVRPDEVEFFVADTGVGIAADDIGKIFHIFRRGRGAAAQAAGKGVGLASVKSIIETYSGTIRVESEPGRGSTFHFTINGQYLADKTRPAAEPSQQPASAAEASAVEPSTAQASRCAA